MIAAPRMETEAIFLGTAAVVPDCGHDTASFIINRKYLVDTGWNAALRMLCSGISPLDLEFLILTHCHHDHYIGLPQLLFYLAMQRANAPDASRLKIIGPEEDLAHVVGLAKQFLQSERFPAVLYEPELIPFKPGDTYENSEFALTCCRALHPVPAISYRFDDKLTGQSIVFTGDTSYSEEIVELSKGAGLLIHEASYGAIPAPVPDSWGHSSAMDAATTAGTARVAQLALVHCSENKQQVALEAARRIFSNTIWPADGEVIKVSRQANQESVQVAFDICRSGSRLKKP